MFTKLIKRRIPKPRFVTDVGKSVARILYYFMETGKAVSRQIEVRCAGVNALLLYVLFTMFKVVSKR